MSQQTPIRLLLTGFEPFGGSTLNPSQVVVEAIQKQEIVLPGVQLHAAMLPVDTVRISSVLDALWTEHEPDIVLHVGESAKADRLTLERVAINLLDFDTPDNAGQLLTDQSIDPQGPAARFATLPVRTLADRLAKDQVPCERSLSAGTYLCNQTLYLSLGHAQQRGGAMVGFVHVPSLTDQVDRGERKGPSMSREQLLDQIQRLITHAIDLYTDGKADAGH